MASTGRADDRQGYNPGFPMSLSHGSTLGPYTIRAELGHGGIGVVYTAQDPRLDRQVATKLLTADLTRDATAKQRRPQRRWLRARPRGSKPRITPPRVHRLQSRHRRRD